MMKSILVILLFSTISISATAQKLLTDSCYIRFFSQAPAENIEAVSTKGQGALNAANGKFVFKVSIKSFEFENKLMQEHFNENYMESDKYPFGKFSGEVGQKIDVRNDGEYTVTASGTLDIHGVEVKRDIESKLTIKDGIINIQSKFIVPLKDHKIKIPRAVITNIAEEIEVTLYANLVPVKDK